LQLAGTWYRVRGMWSPQFLGARVAQPAPTMFGTKVVIATYSPNASCVPNLKFLASTVAPGQEPRYFWSQKLFFGKLYPKSK